MAKILVVEDSLYQRKGIVRSLTEWGHEVLQAENGSAALKVLENETPDIVLTDLLMPEMDGLGLLNAMNDKGINIPTIVLSADIQTSVKVECSSLGAKEFLSKPLDKAQLQQTLAKFLT
ncbi:MAG: response regulator [Bdellovibrionales bacterium]|jgi:CheY-like chemotaxis protein|nr:response regulator [Bdellovibrionales bacterium]